jgi:hypothetical protein
MPIKEFFFHHGINAGCPLDPGIHSCLYCAHRESSDPSKTIARPEPSPG